MGNNNSHHDRTDPIIFNVPQLMTTEKFREYVISRRLFDLPSVTLNLDKNILVEGSDLSLLDNVSCLQCGINQNVTDSFLISNSNTLQRLHCGSNKYISDVGVKSLTNLRHLYCDENTRLTNSCIQNLLNLETLDVGKNMLLSDDGIVDLVNLRSLNCNNTAINKEKKYRFTDAGLSGKHLEYLECSDPTQFSSKLLFDVNPKTLLYGTVNFYYMRYGLEYDGRSTENTWFPCDIKTENKILFDRGWDFDTNQYIQKLVLGGTIIGRKEYYGNRAIYAPRPRGC